MNGIQAVLGRGFLLTTAFLSITIHTAYAQSNGDGYTVTERARDYAVHQKITMENGTNRGHCCVELTNAFRMVAFINQVYDSVPREHVAARDHLKGLQAVFFISDYLMVAKTNSGLVVSKAAIVGAFTNTSSDASMVTDRLRLWAERPGTLTDHYLGISEIPSEKTNIAAIESALTQNGVPIDTENDLLMDCIRYVVQSTDIQEAYGPNPKRSQPTPFPAALDVLVSTSDTVFRHRFETKFGLNPETVTNLMSRLKHVSLYNLVPADIEIPAHIPDGAG